MNIFLFLGSRRGYAVLKKLIEVKAKIAGILCLVEDAHEEQYHPKVTAIANEYSIPIFYSSEVKSGEYKNILIQIKPDIAFVIGWRYLINKETYQIPNKGTLILHDSLLPKYRGFAPMNWAIINGEKETGVSLFYISEGVDSGPIIDQAATEISLNDTAKTVDERLIKLYEELIVRNLPQLESDQVKSIPQNETNFIKKISDKFSDVDNFNILTSLENLQTSLYGCSYFSIFGCFDLSSLRPAYMPLSDNNSSDTSRFSSYTSIFEYMKAHEVSEENCELKAINKENGWRKMITDIKSTVIPDGKGRTAEDHYQAFKKSGARVCTLPDHLVRNQQILGGPEDIKNFSKFSDDSADSSIRHFKGLYARAVYHETRPLNRNGQTLQDSLIAHTLRGKNNRLAYKIESLKTTITSFYDDTSMSDTEKEKFIQDCIWKPTMVIK